jgi:hypothetical protein
MESHPAGNLLAFSLLRESAKTFSSKADSTSASGGTGTVTSSAELNPSARCLVDFDDLVRRVAANVDGSRWRANKIGHLVTSYPTTVTAIRPSLELRSKSKRSSRQNATTIIGVCASSGRSAVTSGNAPCTRRSRQLQKPDARASGDDMVEATVVAPCQPRASDREIANTQLLNFIVESQ